MDGCMKLHAWIENNRAALVNDTGELADKVLIALGLFKVYPDEEHLKNLQAACDNWEKSYGQATVN